MPTLTRHDSDGIDVSNHARRTIRREYRVKASVDWHSIVRSRPTRLVAGQIRGWIKLPRRLRRLSQAEGRVGLQSYQPLDRVPKETSRALGKAFFGYCNRITRTVDDVAEAAIAPGAKQPPPLIG